MLQRGMPPSTKCTCFSKNLLCRS